MKQVLFFVVIFFSVVSNAQVGRLQRPGLAPGVGADWYPGCQTCQAWEREAVRMELLRMAEQDAKEAEKHKQTAEEQEAQGNEGAASNARALSQDYQDRAQTNVDALTGYGESPEL